MSSLLQFDGQIDRRKGVRLEFTHVLEWSEWNTPEKEEMTDTECPICGEKHRRIYVAWRKPAGMFGPWVVFRYLGKENVPDLSIPIWTGDLPKGAVALSDAETFESWHRS